jgi:hypothetical protein
MAKIFKVVIDGLSREQHFAISARWCRGLRAANATLAVSADRPGRQHLPCEAKTVLAGPERTLRPSVFTGVSSGAPCFVCGQDVLVTRIEIGHGGGGVAA